MSKEYRPLLPAPDSRSASKSTPSIREPFEALAKRKRVGVVMACNLCRTKKIRCDGARPVCGICKKRGVQKCTYNGKQDTSDGILELLGLLKALPATTVIEIVEILRANDDVAVVPSLLKKKVFGSWRDDASVSILDELMPEKSPLENELMIKNPVSYPVMRPISKASLGQSSLLRSVNLARPDSHVGTQQTSSSSSSTVDTDRNRRLVSHKVDSDSADNQFRGRSTQEDSNDKIPELCDKRLINLDIAFWTTVPIPSELAAKAISLYLETDHPLLGTFEPNQFVADLVNHRQASCSSFLVHAILYWACQMYSAVDESANEYVQTLAAEAERLWAVEKTSDSILNMVGVQMLSLAFMGYGIDHRVLIYQAESVNMGARLGLLGVDSEIAASRLAKVPKGMLQAYAFAAWGVFNWSMLVTIFYRQPGLSYPKFPPTLPIPGDSGRNSPEGSNSSSPGDATTRYQLPPYMGNTFPAICKFWRIMQEVSLVYFSEGQDPGERVSLDFAELKYREILAWAENLPSPVIRDVENPHHVVIFQLSMWIHAAILDIFRPFINRGQLESLQLKTFSATDSTPVAAYKASVNQLKQLIFHYRSNYTSSSYTILWQTALTYVATAARQDHQEPTWRYWFLLCIYGYETLRRPYRIAEVISRGLLTMTLRDTNITSEDARMIMGEIKKRGLSSLETGIRATFIGDPNMAVSNPEGAMMESLAADFEDMAIFKDFINSPEDAMTS